MLIKLKVTPGAKKDAIVARARDHFDVSVKALAQNNQANIRVQELVGEYFDIPPKSVRFIKGHTAHSKIVEIPDVI